MKIFKSVLMVMECIGLDGMIGLMMTVMFYVFFSSPNTSMLPFIGRVVAYIITILVTILASIMCYFDFRRQLKSI